VYNFRVKNLEVCDYKQAPASSNVIAYVDKSAGYVN